MRKAVSGNISVHFDAQTVVVPDRWVEVHAYPTGEGGIMVFFRDITEHKRTHDLFQSTLQRFYTILSSMYGAILLVTNDDLIEFANPAFCEYFGLKESPEELKGLTAQKMIDRIMPAYLHHEEAISRIKQIVMEGKPVKNEEVMMTDGRVCLRDFVPIFIEGKPYGRVWYHLDITQRKQAENSLRKARDEMEKRVEERTADAERERKRLYDVLEALPGMIYLLTPDHHIVFRNRAFREKFGELDGRHCYELCYGKTEPCDFCESYEAQKTGRPHHWEIAHSDGTFTDAYNFHFTDMAGSPLNLMMGIDITDRKRAEQEAFDSRRGLLRMERRLRMGELSASLSHELNQPLTAILANAKAALRFLKADKLDPVELEEILQDIVADDKRAGDIIRGLRDMVRPAEETKELILISTVLKETALLFNGEAIIRNLRVEIDLSDALPLLVHVNKVQIQQVLINLMMNAAESMTHDESSKK